MAGRPMSARARKALEAWEGRTWKSQAEWYRVEGFARQTCEYWRESYPEFEERFQARRVALVPERLKAATQPTVASLDIEELPISDELQAFLRAYEKTGQRIESAQAAGLDWSEVETALSRDPAAGDRYQRLRRYEEMRIEDALRGRAAQGESAALNSLVRQGLLTVDPAEQNGSGSSGGGSHGRPDPKLTQHYRDRLRVIAMENPRIKP